MGFYSASQFFQDWRYAIAKEFTTSTGEPFPYATNGKQEWGDELGKVAFGEGNSPHDGCISADGKYMAIATDKDIHVVDTQTLKVIAVLRGHVSRVSSVAFKPDDSNTLVSSEEGDYGRVDFPVVPTIYIWDVASQAQRPRDIAADDVLKGVSAAAATTAVEKFKELGVDLGDEERSELEEALIPAVGRVARKQGAVGTPRLHGRLTTSFQSEIFSPSGAWMVYLPGERPHSNDTDTWIMVICSTQDSYSIKFTLEGHTDAIMWTGWSPDESLFASVAWDKSIRIWDAATGAEKYKFSTDGQNWTGGFSKDSRLFASTCGKGTLQVNDMSDGSTKWSVKIEESSQWKRALDWHPDGKILAVGGDDTGDLLLLDVEKQEVVQRRALSPDASNLDDARARVFKRWVGTKEVKFVKDGSILAVWIAGDSSAEVFDLKREVKWRFARGGTDDGPKSHGWRDEDGKVTSKGGSGVLFWETREGEGLLKLASIDFDGVRIWSVSST